MQNPGLDRRAFMKAAGLAAAAGVGGARPLRAAAGRPGPVKLSCNLYSFNGPLRDGSMSLEEVLRICSDLGFAAVDPTAYYLRGYPAVPDDEYLYGVKRRAFLLGLDISGTGVRNDFTQADAAKRKADVELVKSWVDAAAKLDAPVLRVFSGHALEAGQPRAEALGWVVDAFRECAEYGGRHGVMVVLQNHDDFVRTADETLELIRAVRSDWFGLMVDIGSFRTADPYVEIAQTAPYAVTWQIKENLFVRGEERKTDLDRLMRIVRDSGYRGYLPLETLGPGDPREKVPRFLAEVRAAMERVFES